MKSILSSTTTAHTGAEITLTGLQNSKNRRQWHLTVEEGYQLRIEWLDFELEDAWTQKCKFDYVALVDANGQVSVSTSSQNQFSASVFNKLSKK